MVVRGACESVPELIGRSLSETVSSAASCEAHVVEGVALGKKTAQPRPAAVRLIMPLPTLWGLADSFLASALHRWLDAQVPLPPGAMECGVAGVGASHAALGARLVIEKG